MGKKFIRATLHKNKLTDKAKEILFDPDQISLITELEQDTGYGSDTKLVTVVVLHNTLHYTVNEPIEYFESKLNRSE